MIGACAWPRCPGYTHRDTIPPDYGPVYTRGFQGIYPELATEYGIELVAFLMDDVAPDPELMQPEGIHPNAAGRRIVFEHVRNVLAEVLAAHE